MENPAMPLSRHWIGRTFLTWSLAVTFLALPAFAHHSAPKILLFNSDTPQNFWWRTTSDILQAACDDLGMTLEVVYLDRNPYKMIRTFKEVATSDSPPDAVIFQNLRQTAEHMLSVAEQYQIPAILFNAGLVAEEQVKYLGPREVFKYWIGEILPDDMQAGYDLAMTLYHEAVRQGMTDQDDRVNLVAINGTKADTAAIERLKGLMRAVTTQPKINLLQVVNGEWVEEKGMSVFKRLAIRHQNTKVVWSANDPMAIGALEGMRDLGLVPGKDMLIGSIDWDPRALQAVERGEMVVTINGHFMESAWAAVLLYDYLHGRDFAEETVSFKSQMSVLNQDNIRRYLQHFNRENFAKVDFTQFSKVLNPSLESYDFLFAPVLREVSD